MLYINEQVCQEKETYLKGGADLIGYREPPEAMVLLLSKPDKHQGRVLAVCWENKRHVAWKALSGATGHPDPQSR